MDESFGLCDLPDGTCHAWIGHNGFNGDREECLAWIEGPQLTGEIHCVLLPAGLETFLRAILTRPGNAMPRLIFADWLEERGYVPEASGERWRAENPGAPWPPELLHQ